MFLSVVCHLKNVSHPPVTEVAGVSFFIDDTAALWDNVGRQLMNGSAPRLLCVFFKNAEND